MKKEELILTLTLEEKAALLQGWSEWKTLELPQKDIPAMFLSDGSHGLRKQMGAADHLGLNASIPATCFPTAATMANSWDVDLGEELGRALGEEAAANDVNVLLGPGLNIKRSPLCGRNFEYFSEDPFLTGKMAAAYIRGIQTNGISACPKHFAVNSQETRRMAMNSVLDERTLREIYLTGFEIAVREGAPKSIMSAYNMVNGIYANENKHLLNEILRSEWGFDGFVVSDWGADNDHIEGLKAGSNLVMPSPGADCAVRLINAVRDGRILENVLDNRLRELLTVIDSTNEVLKNRSKTFDVDAHHEIARRCAEGSIVLLENDGILPLDSTKGVAVIGDFAKTPRFQGAGSSMVNPTKLDNLMDCLMAEDVNIIGYAQGYSRTQRKVDKGMVDCAVELAKMAEVILLCVGLDEIAESEGLDRETLELSEGQQALIKAVCGVNKNIILVFSGGSPFVLPKRTTYRAAIHGYLGGQAGAAAMAAALVGKVNPSGKLNETWPESLESNPSYRYFPAKEQTAEYREGLYIGYRYYDTAGIPVRYPFGYGLSYTSFTYSDIITDEKSVTFTLTNTGKYDGAEIAQVYISCQNGMVFRPKKELKGFTKVFLKAGESKSVTIPLDDKAFRYFNIKTKAWEIEAADYEISVAASVSDVRLTKTIKIVRKPAPIPYGNLPSYENGKVSNVSESEFEELLGRPIPNGKWSGELTKNAAICQLYYAKSGIARTACKILTHRKKRLEAKGKIDINLFFIYNMPLRALCKMTGGMVSERMVDDIVFLVNGHFWRGLGRLIADFFRNKRESNAFMKELGVK